MIKTYIIAVFTVLSTALGFSQQLDQIGKKGGIKFSGGIGVN